MLAAALLAASLLAVIQAEVADGGPRRLRASPLARLGKGPPAAAHDAVALVEVQEGAPAASVPLSGLTQANVSLEPIGGECKMVKGPAEGDGLGHAHMWSSGQDHLLCFPTNIKEAMTFTAKATPKPDPAIRGEFGFGEGSEVGIRPNFYSKVQWHLEDGVETLPLPVAEGEPLQLMSLEVVDGATSASSAWPLVLLTPPEGLPFSVVLADANATQTAHCEPDLEFDRFVCRARLDSAGEQIYLVVVAVDRSDEAGQSDALSVQAVLPTHGKEAEKTRTVAQQQAGLPWVGWQATAPTQQTAAEAVHFRVSAADADGGTQYEVVLVLGSATLSWDVQGPPPEWYRPAGRYLALVSAGSFGLYAVLLLMQSIGLPAPSTAPLPMLCCTLVNLQLFALVGSAEDAPARLRMIAEPLQPLGAVAPTLALLGAAIGLHALAVVRHIVRNGEGAVESLPHGLLFGSWELRLLGVLVMPLSFWVGALIFQPGVYIGEPAYFGYIVIGVLLVMVQVAIPITVYRTVRRWEEENKIINISLPGCADMFWTDTHCDQLRAIPMNTVTGAGWGSFMLFRKWTTNSSWFFAPSIARTDTISYTRVSPGKSVWGRAGKTGKDLQRHDHGDDLTHTQERGRSRDGARQPSNMSFASGANVGANNGPRMARMGTDLSMKAPGEGDAASQSTELLPALYAHPIRVITYFVYSGGISRPRIAGLAGLPWLQVAVPCQALRQLESELKMVELRVHQGQLTGKLTGGRLSAAFDWCDRCYWRWSADFIAKVVLGLYLAFLRVTGSHKGWGVLHLSVSAACLCGCAATIRYRPYTAHIDNMALVVTLATVAMGVTQYFLARHVVSMANILPGAMLASTSLLAVVLAFMSLCAILTSLISMCRSLPDKVVPSIVREWQIRAVEPKAGSKVQPDKASGGAAEKELLDKEDRRCVDAEVVLQQHGHSILMPGRLRAAAQVHEVKVRRALPRAASWTSSALGRIRVSVDAVSLFWQKRQGMPVVQPCGALNFPDRAFNVFEQASLNDRGMTWEALLSTTIQEEATAKEAAEVLKEAIEKRSQVPEQRSDKNGMPIIQVVSD